jgi:hypothetical protein
VLEQDIGKDGNPGTGNRDQGTGKDGIKTKEREKIKNGKTPFL